MKKPNTYKINECKVQTIKVYETPEREFCKPETFNQLWTETVAKADWYDAEKEHAVVFALDSRLRVKGFFLVSVGTLNEAHIHPREVFRPLVACAAASFVIMHNHPTGNPSPSDADRRVTKRLIEAERIMGIAMNDHIIHGSPDSYFSFREHGFI